MWLVVKFTLSAAIVVAVSEISRRSMLLASMLVSLPLISILSFIFIYIEGKSTAPIISMSYEILWMVPVPCLAFFLLLPYLLKAQMSFWIALPISCVAMAASYGAVMWVKSQWFS